MLRYLAKNEDAYLQWESVLDMLSMFVDALPLMDEEDNLSKPSGAHLAGQGAGGGEDGQFRRMAEEGGARLKIC